MYNKQDHKIEQDLNQAHPKQWSSTLSSRQPDMEDSDDEEL